MDEQNLYNSNNKICGYPVFNAVFARILYREGFKLIDFCRNYNKKNKFQHSTVYFFEDTEELKERINELVKEQQTKKREDILQEGD